MLVSLPVKSPPAGGGLLDLIDANIAKVATSAATSDDENQTRRDVAMRQCLCTLSEVRAFVVAMRT